MTLRTIGTLNERFIRDYSASKRIRVLQNSPLVHIQRQIRTGYITPRWPVPWQRELSTMGRS